MRKRRKGEREEEREKNYKLRGWVESRSLGATTAAQRTGKARTPCRYRIRLRGVAPFSRFVG